MKVLKIIAIVFLSVVLITRLTAHYDYAVSKKESNSICETKYAGYEPRDSNWEFHTVLYSIDGCDTPWPTVYLKHLEITDAGYKASLLFQISDTDKGATKILSDTIKLEHSLIPDGPVVSSSERCFDCGDRQDRAYGAIPYIVQYPKNKLPPQLFEHVSF